MFALVGCLSAGLKSGSVSIETGEEEGGLGVLKSSADQHDGAQLLPSLMRVKPILSATQLLFIVRADLFHCDGKVS